MNLATVTLHIVHLTDDIGAGVEVIITPVTFAVSVNTIILDDAMPVFADIDPQIGYIDPNELEKKITSKTKVIVPVHCFGQTCNLDKIYEIVD